MGTSAGMGSGRDAIRESLLQRRLGFQTGSSMTAAGWGIYEARDLTSAHATAFADDAAPGLLTPVLEGQG